MACGMFGPADVEIHLFPIVHLVLRSEPIGILRIHVAQEIPAASGPAGHGCRFERKIPLTPGPSPKERGVIPVFCSGQGWFAGLGRLEFVDLRKHQRQVFFFHRIRDPVLVIDGYRLAPIALAAESGIAQTIVDPPLACIQFLQLIDRRGDRFRNIEAIEKTAVDQLRILAFIRALIDIGALCYGDDRQSEMLREIPVALIAAGHCHHSAGTVAAQNIITHPDRDLFTGERMDAIRAGEDAAHAFHISLAFAFAAVLCAVHVGHHFLFPIGRHDPIDELVLRRKRDKSDAEEGIGAGGEDFDVRPHPLPLSSGEGGGMRPHPRPLSGGEGGAS